MPHLPQWEAEDLFDDFLDETNKPITLLGMTYEPSTVLKECDPIAYQVIFGEWVDGEAKEGRFTVDGYHEPQEEDENA